MRAIRRTKVGGVRRWACAGKRCHGGCHFAQPAGHGAGSRRMRISGPGLIPRDQLGNYISAVEDLEGAGRANMVRLRYGDAPASSMSSSVSTCNFKGQSRPRPGYSSNLTGTFHQSTTGVSGGAVSRSPDDHLHLSRGQVCQNFFSRCHSEVFQTDPVISRRDAVLRLSQRVPSCIWRSDISLRARQLVQFTRCWMRAASGALGRRCSARSADRSNQRTHSEQQKTRQPGQPGSAIRP